MSTLPTPGPWATSYDLAGKLVVVSPDLGAPGSMVLAHVHHWQRVGESEQTRRLRAEADARLIAAAPTLLAALEKIVAITGSTGGHKSMVNEFQFIARNALAKVQE